MPIVPDSQLPGLLGLNSMQERRSILDTITKRLYFLGPGDYNLEEMLPTGTECYQLTTAPSGHLILPLNRYAEFDKRQTKGSLQLDQTTVALPVTAASTSEPLPATAETIARSQPFSFGTCPGNVDRPVPNVVDRPPSPGPVPTGNPQVLSPQGPITMWVRPRSRSPFHDRH